MKGSLKKLPIVASAFEFRYMGGSMGSVVGQKFVDTVNYAQKINYPWFAFQLAVEQECRSHLFHFIKWQKLVQHREDATS